MADQPCERRVSRGSIPAYPAGLLHSIGQLALFQYAPDQYVEDLKLCCSGGGDLLEQEHETYGTDHAALSSAILTQWGLAELHLTGDTCP